MQLFYALRAEHAKIFLLARTWPPSLLVQCHRDADRTVKRQMRKVVPNSAETVFFRDCLLRTPGRSSRDPGCTLSPVITIAMLAFCNLKNPYRSFIVQAVFRTPVCRQRPSAQRFPPPCFHRIVVMRRNACKQPCNAFAAGTTYTDHASSPRRSCE